MNWPKHGELRGSDRYDRVSMAWVRADEWQVRQWEREDRAFARRANQGELTTPMIVTDGQGGVRGVQSMLDGKFYDSKSSMRRHYRERGATEVGNDMKIEPADKRKANRPPDYEKRIDRALGRAFDRVGLPPV